MRDRTAEFAAIVAAATATTTQKDTTRNVFLGKAPLQSAHGTHVAATAQTPRSDFSRLAALVGSDIAQTSIKLSKLTTLAQRRSLFDDPTAEIQELTFVIKQDIGALNSRLEDLQRLRDATRRASNKQAGDHSENVVDSLKSRLGATAEGFKSVLKMRTESLAAQQDRRSQFMGASASGSLKPDASGGNFSSSMSLPSPADGPNSVALDLGGGSLGGSATGVGVGTGSGQHLTLMRRPQESTYQEARADAVRQVESTILELGQIFNQLATMVSEQGEMVERIDSNIEETVANMDAGHNQLLVYYNSISGNRGLILKVFGVLLAFLVLWTIMV
jgi:syntaxin 5